MADQPALLWLRRQLDNRRLDNSHGVGDDLLHPLWADAEGIVSDCDIVKAVSHNIFRQPLPSHSIPKHHCGGAESSNPVTGRSQGNVPLAVT
jgi:hypothetical protein